MGAAANEGTVSAAFDLGTVFWKFGQFDDAESWYTKAYEMGATRSSLRLGDMLAAVGRVDAAQSWWNVAASHGITEATDRKIIEADYLDHDLTKVIASASIEENLGEIGVAETFLNLWPNDCQTCGKSLGVETPTLYFTDIMVRRMASLHHAVCREPAWDSDNQQTSDPLLSWRTFTFVTTLKYQNADVLELPVVIVNPTLESVWLHEGDEGWRVSTVDQYERDGFRRLDYGIPTPTTRNPYSRVVPHASISEEYIAVSFNPAAIWSAPIDRVFLKAAKALGGFSLWVTTRLSLASGKLDAAHLGSLIKDAAIVGRWIHLEANKNDSRNKSRSSRDYVVYWTIGEAIAGEAVDYTTAHKEPEDAIQWANIRLDQLGAGNDNHHWSRTSSTGGLRVLGSESAQYFFLHQHENRWILSRAIAHISGEGFEGQGDAQSWATEAVRFKLEEGEMAWKAIPQVRNGGAYARYSQGRGRK